MGLYVRLEEAPLASRRVTYQHQGHYLALTVLVPRTLRGELPLFTSVNGCVMGTLICGLRCGRVLSSAWARHA